MNKTARWRYIGGRCAVAILLFVGATPTLAQEGDFEDWQRDELQELVNVVGSAMQGDLVQVEDPFSVRTDYLKGTDEMTYVPFRVTIDPSQVSTETVAMYLFVLPTEDVPPPSDDDDFDMPDATFESAFFIDVTEGRDDDEPIEIRRAFTAPAGQYEVYVAIADSVGEDADDDDREAAAKMMVRRQVDVPNYWNGELQTSSVVLAQTVEPLPRPLTPDEQGENPYTLGTTRIVPKPDTTFGKTDELSLIMLVYNPEAEGSTPNVTIEYNFHQQTDGGEEFFNKTNPQEFNRQTLPPGFDLDAGHQIVAGQSVPLRMFPAGDFRLEIKVMDNASGSSVTQDVNFTVTE